MKEPIRKSGDDETQGPPSWSDTWRYVRANRPLLHLIAGLVLANATSTSFTAWIISFLHRVHDVPLPTTGLLVGVGVGLFSAIGSYAGGAAGNGLRWSGYMVARIPAMVMAAAAGGVLLMIFPENLYVVIGGMLLFKLFLHAHTGPGFNLLISSVPPRMRGRTVSSVQALANVLGGGCGPLLVGALSDAIGGPNSLRWALLLVLPILGTWASLHFFLASLGDKKKAIGSQVDVQPEHAG